MSVARQIENVLRETKYELQPSVSDRRRVVPVQTGRRRCSSMNTSFLYTTSQQPRLSMYVHIYMYEGTLSICMYVYVLWTHPGHMCSTKPDQFTPRYITSPLHSLDTRDWYTYFIIFKLARSSRIDILQSRNKIHSKISLYNKYQIQKEQIFYC